MAKTVLVLVPHPDDAEISAGGTIARMAREGARVIIVVASSGNKGSFAHDAPTLARVRAEEARRAAAVLGAEPPVLLEHPDFELDRLPPGALREQFIRAIRQQRPDLLIAQDPWTPYEGHPDHRAVAWAASDAVNFASLPLVHPEHLAEGLEPHYVAEKYFYGTGAADVDRVVDIGETIELKLAALAEHKSQVSFLVEDVLGEARAAGVDVPALLGQGPRDPLELMGLWLRAQAAAVGQPAGFAYGEAFRYLRFHPYIESLLAGQQPALSARMP